MNNFLCSYPLSYCWCIQWKWEKWRSSFWEQMVFLCSLWKTNKHLVSEWRWWRWDRFQTWIFIEVYPSTEPQEETKNKCSISLCNLASSLKCLGVTIQTGFIWFKTLKTEEFLSICSVKWFRYVAQAAWASGAPCVHLRRLHGGSCTAVISRAVWWFLLTCFSQSGFVHSAYVFTIMTVHVLGWLTGSPGDG